MIAIVRIADGALLHIVQNEAAAQLHDLAGCQLVPAPADYAAPVYDFIGGAFVLSVAHRQNLLWTEVKAYRTARLNGSAMTPAGLVQVDYDSRENLRTLIDLGEETELRLSDNSFATVSSAQLALVKAAVDAFVAQTFTRSWELEAAIKAAPTIAALEAIDIEAGWPE
jgi:hypothetical protein